jgi:hypothetical protein
MMDEGGVLIVNLAKGRLGEDATNLLGGIFVSTIGLAAMSRAEIAPSSRRPFFLYVDEFQTFTTLAFVIDLAQTFARSALSCQKYTPVPSQSYPFVRTLNG